MAAEKTLQIGPKCSHRSKIFLNLQTTPGTLLLLVALSSCNRVKLTRCWSLSLKLFSSLQEKSETDKNRIFRKDPNVGRAASYLAIVHPDYVHCCHGHH